MSTAVPVVGQPTNAKTPRITAMFWVLKLLSTGMGEAASDWLVHRLGTFPAVGLGAVAFTVGIIVQLRAPRYSVVKYWTAICLVAVFGTMVADAAHVALAIPYAVSTLGGALSVAAIMLLWHRQCGTISLDSVTSGRVEHFYWLTVVATFALGTAAGDWTARTLNFGYVGSTVLFFGLLLIPALWFLATKRFGVASFWAAYVITRPLGASFADYLGMPHARSGLGLGLGLVTLIWLLVIIGLVMLSRQLEARSSTT